MKPDLLHRFLHSINPGEQRICRKMIAADTGKWAKQRKVLFDTLMGQKTFNKDKLNKVFGNSPYLKELSIEKTRMLKRLMHTVNAHRDADEDNRDPMEKLRESQLFFSFGFIEEAIALAEAGLERAKHTGDPLAETYLREHLRQLFKHSRAKHSPQMEEQNAEGLVAAAERTATMMELHAAADKVGRHYERYRSTADPNVLQTLEDLMAHPLLCSFELSFAKPADGRNLWTMALYQDAVGNLPAAADLMGIALVTLERFPAYTAMLPEQLIVCLYELIHFHTRLGRAEMAQDLLPRLEEKVKLHGMKDRAIAFACLQAARQHCHIAFGRPQQVLTSEHDVRQQLAHFGDLVCDKMHLTLCYNIGIAHLMVGNNGKALAMFSHIRDMGRKHNCLDLQGLARLFRLLLMLERHSHDNYEHYLRNSRRFFTADHPLSAVKKVICTWLNMPCEHPEIRMSQKRLQALYRQLTPMVIKGHIGADELRLWALSRATGTPIMHLIADRDRGRQQCA